MAEKLARSGGAGVCDISCLNEAQMLNNNVNFPCSAYTIPLIKSIWVASGKGSISIQCISVSNAAYFTSAH